MLFRDFIDYKTRRRRRHKARLRAETQFREVLLALKPGDLAIDCGANVGDFTRLLAMTGATVHAFEPDPVAFAELQTRTARLANVHLHQAAVGVESGDVFLRRASNFDSDPVGRTIASSVVEGSKELDEANAIRVEQVSLIDFLEGLAQPVALLKIDIEGAEVALIEAMIEKGMAASVRAAFVETHERRYRHLRARTLAMIRDGRAHLPGWNFDWR